MEEYTNTSVECVSLDESALFMTSDGKHLHSEINGDLAALNGQFSAKDSAKDLVMIKGYNADLHRQVVGVYKKYLSPCSIGNPYPKTIRIKGVPITVYMFSTTGVYKNRMYKLNTLMAADMVRLATIKETLFESLKIPKDIVIYAIKNANPNFSLKITRKAISSMLTGIGYRENTAFNNAVLNYTNTRHPEISATMVGTAIQNIIQFKQKIKE